MIHLIEIDAWDVAGGAIRSLRYCDMPDARATTVGGKLWLPCAEGVSTSVSVANLSGDLGPAAGRVSVAGLRITLEKADFATLGGLIIRGRSVRIYRGAFGASFEAFTLVYSGSVEDVPFSQASGVAVLTLQLSALGGYLDTEVLSATYAGTGDAEGPSGLEGKLKPAAFGECLNVPPVQVNQAYQIYQVHGYGPIEAVSAVFQRGVAMFATGDDYADYDALKAASIRSGGFATCKALGLFRLSGEAQEPLTCDIKGDNTGGFSQTVPDIIRRMASIAGIDDALIDSASFTAYAALAGEPSCWYQDSSRTLSEVASELLAQQFGYWATDASGRMILGLIRGDGPVVTLPREPSRVERLATSAKPLWKRRLGYKPVWRVQGSGEYNEPIPGGGAAAAFVATQIINPNYEMGDYGWDYEDGLSIEEAPELTINGRYAGIFDPDAQLTSALTTPMGDDKRFINKGLVPVSLGQKLYFRGRALAEAGADGELYLGCLFVDSSATVIAEATTGALPITEGRNDLFGEIEDVPDSATHFRFVFGRRGGTTGRVGADDVLYFQNLTEQELDALRLSNGPSDPYAQVNRPLFGLRAGYDQDGEAAPTLVAVVGWIVAAGGDIELTHDNTRTWIPIAGLMYQLRADALETANCAFMPDGSWPLVFDKSKTAKFAHLSGADRDLAPVKIQGDDIKYWRVGSTAGASGWVAMPSGDFAVIGTVTMSGGVVADADHYAAGERLDTFGELGSTRLLFTGPYEAGRQYRFGEVVQYQNRSFKFIAGTPATGVTPGTATHWQEVAGGSIPRSGEGLPANSLGFVGDTYTDTLTFNQYVKVDANTWEFVGNFGGAYPDYRFQRSATQPATPVGDDPAGWYDAPPAADGTKLWQTYGVRNFGGDLVITWSEPQEIGGSGLEVQYSVDGATLWHGTFADGDIYMRQRLAGGTWSGAIRIVGEEGRYKDYIYRRAATQPSTPTGDNPSGWSDGVPALDGNPAWESYGFKNADGELIGAWSTPVLESRPGYERQYSANASSWHDTVVDGDVYFRERAEGSGAWGAAVRFKGEDGAAGLAGNFRDYRYRRAATQPATPTGNNPAGWSDGQPALDGNPCWESQALKDGNDVLIGSWSTPVLVNRPGYERQYSTNASSWHSTVADGDVYFRERPEGSGTWGAAVRFKGEDGGAGSSGFSAMLTNDSTVVSTASNGTGGDYTNAGGEMKLYEGAVEKTSGVSYSVVSTTGGLTITINSSSGVYTVTGCASDQGSAVLRAAFGGVNYDKIYSLAKSKAGGGSTARSGVSSLSTPTAVTHTSYTQYGSTISLDVGADGETTVQYILQWSTSGLSTLYAKAQWRNPGGSWTDFTSEELTAGDSGEPAFTADTVVTAYSGSLATKEFRLLLKKSGDNPTINNFTFKASWNNG